MFVTVGYLLLGLVRWYSQKRRRYMLLNAVRQVYRSSSVLVQRAACVPTDEGSLRGSPLVSRTVKFVETGLLEDDNSVWTTITPQHCVNLRDWTLYGSGRGSPHDWSLAGPVCEYGETSPDDDLLVMLEAVRPADVAAFLTRMMHVAPVYRVHLLAHGEAVAWRRGTPFGILLHCSLDDFVTLSMAFTDGFLAMDEDMEVHRLLTVTTAGNASNLITEASGEPSITVSGPDYTNNAAGEIGNGVKSKILPDDHLAEDLTHTLVGQHEYLTDLCSNESLADNSSIGRVDFSVNDTIDVEDIDEIFADTNAGEGLSEMTLEDSSNTLVDSLSQSWRWVRTMSMSAPPNVLIYVGKTDTARKFEKVKTAIEQCLDSESYVIYRLKHEEIDSCPWTDNTSLLVVADWMHYKDVNDVFYKYFQNGGRILALGSGFDNMLVGIKKLRKEIWISELTYKTWSDVSLIVGKNAYDMDGGSAEDVAVKRMGVDQDGNVVLVKVSQKSKHKSGCAILSQILFDKDPADLVVTPEMFNRLKKSNASRFEILIDLLTMLGLECSTHTTPILTPAALITRNKELKTNFLKSIQNRLVAGVLKFGGQNLKFTTNAREPVGEMVLPVVTENVEAVCGNFSDTVYLQNLSSEVLGNTVMYMDSVPSTMTLLDGLLFSVPKDVGLIAIARQQTSGKGRGGNLWLSPVGCAMFTLHVRVPLDSPLGRGVSFLQHITSVAVINSVCGLPGYQDIDLKLKWPNDVYYGSEMKIGGILVKSTIMDGVVHATIGCGFNVSNSNPTICINDLIQLYNRQQGHGLVPCTPEQLIARTVSCIEALVQQFQQDGAESFRQIYYKMWLHSDQKVTLQSEDNLEVRIVGLDDFGYLLVETPRGDQISVQPDGNSFDMMQNLIRMKTR